MTQSSSPYELNLGRNRANFVPLSPISHLRRTAQIYPERIAVIYGERQWTWAQFAERCRLLANALETAGIRRGDTVAAMLPNVPVGL